MYDRNEARDDSSDKRDDLKLDTNTFATSGAGALGRNGGNPTLEVIPMTHVTCWGLCPSMGTYTC